MIGTKLSRLEREIESFDGLHVEARLRFDADGYLCSLPVSVGDQCEVRPDDAAPIAAEVVRILRGQAQIMPYERANELRVGLPIVRQRQRRLIPMGEGVLGRILDGLGRPIDGKGPLRDVKYHEIHSMVPSAIDRPRISKPLWTGQKAIDGLLTCGRGQRIGIFSGSGVGKSTLLGQLANSSDADINVISLVGERGVELRPFIDDCLGVEGLERSVIVISTSDQSALLRKRSVETAIAIADDFRQAGNDVLFLLDSLTRLAMAQREIGLTLGEPPSSRGYTPSVFQEMASLLEILGNDEVGSITGFVTVLVDGDDLDEPVSDAARALLDGHIVLDRSLAERHHFPAINIARSVSRAFNDLCTPQHRTAAQKFRAIMANYADVEDLIRVGSYRKGAYALTDTAIELMPHVNAFLRQQLRTFHSFEETLQTMGQIAARWPD